MENQTRFEAKARTLKLDAQEVNSARIDKLVAQLDALGRQTHEQRLGFRVKMSKRRKIAKGNKLIDRAFRNGLDIKQDAINQLKILTKALNV